MGAAISSGCPTRFMACIPAMWFMRSDTDLPCFSAICSKISVWMAAAQHTHAHFHRFSTKDAVTLGSGLPAAQPSAQRSPSA